MPLHDWSPVPDAQFHAFHLGWLWNLARALNGGVLPAGYVARPEEYVGPFQADVLTLETGDAPPAPAASRPGLEPTCVLAPPRHETWRERRVTVFSARDERRVAVIEVVSPGNKDSRPRAEFFQRRLVECLGAGLHLLVIDLLPPTTAAPGFAARVARDLGDAEGRVRATGREVTSFERQSDPLAIKIYQRDVAVGAPLPDMPLFLLRGAHVLAPLEATYSETVAALPAIDRARLQ